MRYLLALAATLTLAAPAQAHTIRKAVFTIPVGGAATCTLADGPNMQLTSVRVNGHRITVGDESASGDATMYGQGVALRFAQRPYRNTVRGVSVNDRPTRVVVRYYVYKDPA